MGAYREAYDLHNKTCRSHFKKALKRGVWRYKWFWEMVIDDTRKRVCSGGKP